MSFSIREARTRFSKDLLSMVSTASRLQVFISSEPAASMIDRLAQLKPREMRRVLLAAFGNAKLSQRQEVIAEDVTAERVVRKARIGF